MATNKHIVGAYDTEHEAIQAVEKLRAEGYRPEDISVISKNKDDVEAVTEETGTKTEEGLGAGAATGGVLGGLTGLLAGVGALAIPGIGPIVAAGPILCDINRRRCWCRRRRHCRSSYWNGHSRRGSTSL